jgi:multidrug transporter EmrE-like cation transporter
MNLSTFAFIITGVLLNACAQVLLKAGTNALGGAIHLTMNNWFQTGLKVATQLPILAGLAYPMLSLGYVVSAAGAWLFLGEAVSLQRLLAIAVIMVGVALLART